MLADLFDDPNSGGGTVRFKSQHDTLRPPALRRDSNMCGIINQGATCYLNSLIQTLFFTKEFRERLFNLNAEELGLVDKNGQAGTKQRIILIELQRLFSQLLLLNQDACSTNKLTDSFGWTNSEELQQHDVQELNRILFSAIEQSLVNTRQAKLIQELYKGVFVNKIKCLECLNIVEREEEFLDLQITVQGSSGLYESLQNSFGYKEKLTGNNQYKCEKCQNQYRDAEKYCQLKSLPPILTMSLLRFTYDLRTFERIKETGRFEFPFEIDLGEFMEDTIKLAESERVYELFSVVIHSGNAYGGHYHAYIKDLDQLGKWTLKEEYEKYFETTASDQSSSGTKEIYLICNDDSEDNEDRKNKELVNLDYIKYEMPLDLLKAFIYNKYKYDEIKVDSICSDLTKTTGMSWNKRFKSKYGTIEKFLRKHDDSFEIVGPDTASPSVRLRLHDRIHIVSSKDFSNETEVKDSDQFKSQEKKLNISEEDRAELSASPALHWFNFDDSRVTPIFASSIKKQFEGKESAYMLFYRKKSLKSNTGSQPKMHNWLLDEIRNQNMALDKSREEYESSVNMHELDIYLDSDFYIEKSILNLNHQSENLQFKIKIDKRTTCVKDLKELLVTQCSDQGSENNDRKESCLRILLEDDSVQWLVAKRVNTGGDLNSFYVKSELKDMNANIFNSLIPNASDSFLVLSRPHVKWPVGDEYEPVRLVLKFFHSKQMQIKEISFKFVKSDIIGDVKKEMSSFMINEETNYELGLTNEEMSKLAMDSSYSFSLVRAGKEDNKLALDTEKFDSKTIGYLSIKSGDFIVAETPDTGLDDLLQSKSAQHQSAPSNKYSNKMHRITVINQSSTISNLSTVEIKAEECELISNIKLMAISAFDNLNPSSLALDISNSHLRCIDEQSQTDDEALVHCLATNLSNNLNLDTTSTLSDSSKSFSELGYCLLDDYALGDVIAGSNNSTSLVFLLASGRAPLRSNNEGIVKCTLDRSIESPSEQKNTETLINLRETTVGELTNRLVENMLLTTTVDEIAKNGESYYLKKLDWLGDVERVLNDMSKICADATLDHNSSLLLTRGKLVPPNHLKINVWVQMMDNQTDSQHELDVNDLLEKKFTDFKPIQEEIIVSNDLKLEELQVFIYSILIDKNIQYKDPLDFDTNMRLRVMRQIHQDYYSKPAIPKFQLKRVLLDSHKQLKQLNLTQETDICVQISDQLNNINQGVVLIDCARFNLTTRLCSNQKQLYWNVNNGATYQSLRESIMKTYDLEQSDVFRLVIAKRLSNKLQWIIIKDASTAGEETTTSEPKKTHHGKNKKKKAGNQQQSHAKSNLRSAPFNLDDGDLIVFALSDNSKPVTPQDFLSEEDMKIVKKSNLSQAEINRLRNERKNEPKKRSVRPEVGIKIKIDNFD